MKAIRIHTVGGPEVLSLDEVDVPEPGPLQARVAVRFAGVNFIDTYHRSGLYDLGSLPARIGREGSGVVEAVGSEVTSPKVGDRVVFFDATGGYAQKVIVPAHRLLPLPEKMAFDIGAALPLQGMTADYLVRTIGAVAAGQVVLIHAVAGGVGLLATQLAKAAGATVLGTCSTPAKAEAAREAGCDYPILYNRVDFAEEAVRHTNGHGCDLVLDGVGRATFAGSVRATRVRGKLVLFGQSSGMVEPFSPRQVLGSRTLVTASLHDYTRDPAEAAERWRRIRVDVAAGRLIPTIDRVLRLDEAADAHVLLEGRRTSGKLLLSVA